MDTVAVSPLETVNNTLNILIVDDDLVDRMTVRRALRSPELRFTITEAEDVTSTLAALKEKTFDCVVLDYRLPGVDGLGILIQIRALGNTVPVIMLTGQGDEQLVVAIMRAGATDYLSKSTLSSENLTLSIRNAVRVHKAEQALRESEARFRTMADSAPVLLWMASSDGKRLFFNESWLQFTGHSQEEEAGTQWQLRIHPQDLAGYVATYEASLAARKPFEAEFRLQRNDGQYRWMLESVTPRLTVDQDLVGWIGSSIDITERKLFSQRQQFLVEASRLLFSLDREVIFTSLATLSVPYLADWCTVDVVDEEDANKINRVAVAVADNLTKDNGNISNELKRVHSLQGHETCEFTKALRTGEALLYADFPKTMFAVLDEGHQLLAEKYNLVSLMIIPLIVRGQALGVVTFASTQAERHYEASDLTFAKDLSQRTAIAVDNAQLYHEAQEAVRVREVFLSVASHELKTPLTSLLGNIQLFMKRTSRENTLNERDTRSITAIQEQANRLHKLIGALLDISRLQGGKLSVEREYLDLAVLVRRIVEEIQPTLERHSIEFEDYNGVIPIWGDALRLEQVIQNLIQNGVKYSPKGGVIKVKIGLDQNHGYIAITDSGIGIPKEALLHLFDRFFRASNARERSIGGMGLGLYVVKEIITLHDGTIEVSSTEGQGSSFIVRLPLREAKSST